MLTHIAATASVLFVRADEKLTAFLELESTTRVPEKIREGRHGS
jgi:hypothetical protein